MDAAEWDGRAERDVGQMIARYLAEQPAPAGSKLADDFAEWARNLERIGEARLRRLGARTDLHELAIDVRTYNALMRVGVQTVEDLAGLTEGQVQAVPGISPKGMRCIHEALSTFAAQHYAGTDAPDWSRLLGEEGS